MSDETPEIPIPENEDKPTEDDEGGILARAFTHLAAQALQGRGEDYPFRILVGVLIGFQPPINEQGIAIEGAPPQKNVDIFVALPPNEGTNLAMVQDTLLSAATAINAKQAEGAQRAAEVIHALQTQLQQGPKVQPVRLSARDLAAKAMTPNREGPRILLPGQGQGQGQGPMPKKD